jgi:flagellar biosynthetic protein FliP
MFCRAATIPVPKIGVDIGTSDILGCFNKYTGTSSFNCIVAGAVNTYYDDVIYQNHHSSFFLRNALGTANAAESGFDWACIVFIVVHNDACCKQINEQAYAPYTNGQKPSRLHWTNLRKLLRSFMLKQTLKKDLALFVTLWEKSRTEQEENYPNRSDTGLPYK